MKKLFLPLFLLVIVPCFAQQDPEEIITDFGIDEFIYVPKSTLNFGVRYMTGAKVSFGGKGVIGSFKPAGDGSAGDMSDATSNVQRVYDNGSYVTTDARKDSAGNPITPDGFTNSWQYINQNQVVGDNIEMKSYQATTADVGTLEKDADAGTGIEVSVTKDFGKLFGTRIRWGITGGVSLNDIHASVKEYQVIADVTTLTDTYALAPGSTVPSTPYAGPTTNYEQLKDANGELVWNDEEKTIPTPDYDKPYDASLLIGNKPFNRTLVTDVGNNTLVQTSFLLKGSYYTLRVGPTFYIPITEKLRVSLSGGVAAIYAGTNYRVVSAFMPDEGLPISQDIESDESKLLMGYYVDANVEYIFTETTGVYFGAVYQSSGSYDQTVSDPTGQSLYTTRVDLKQLQGLRAGMTYRF